jgi:hypothetical protein
MSVAILAYKPHSSRILTLNNTIAMSKYAAFNASLSFKKLYKASQTLRINAVKVIAMSIISIPTFSLCCSCCTSLAALGGRDDLCLWLRLQQLRLERYSLARGSQGLTER